MQARRNTLGKRIGKDLRSFGGAYLLALPVIIYYILFHYKPLLGAVIAFFLQWGLYEAVSQGVANNDTLQLIHIIPFEQLWVPVAAVFAGAGIVIGVGGSLSAIRKFLQV